MEISFASSGDELKLKRLFLNCFDDTLGFVNMFFDHYFSEDNTLVAEENGEKVGLLFMLPCTAEEKQCFYVYGVCVSPDFRKNGIGTALIKAAQRVASERGGKIILHPEDEELFSFYEKAGLSPAAYLREVTVVPEGEAVTLFPITPAEYKTLRDSAFSKDNPVLWDSYATEYALLQETFFGGTSYRFECDEANGIVLCGRAGGEPFIKETTAPPSLLPRVCAAVCKKLGGESVRVWLPDSTEVGTKKTVGYGNGFSNDLYLNLMLD